jgi:hypothetical protein
MGANIYPGIGGLKGGPTWTFYMEPGVSRYLPLLGSFGVLRFRDIEHYTYSPDLALFALHDEPATMTAYRVEGMAAESGELPDRVFAGRWSRRGPAGLPLQIGLDGLSAGDKAVLARVTAKVGWTPGTGAAEFSRRAIDLLVRSHGYSLSPRIPPGKGDPLVKWMDSTEPGHCELFAGALVLMARSEGIPARVVTGFKGGTWNAYSGNYTIRNSDAHAWTEIWDATKRAWLREDPLAPAAAADPSKEVGPAALAGLMDRSWSARLSSLRVFWYRRIVNFDQQSQLDTMRSVKAATDSYGKMLRAAVHSLAAWARGWLRGPWSRARIAGACGAALAGFAAYWLLVAGRWRLKFFRRARDLDPVRREAGRWLCRVDEPEALVADLQRLRFGPAPTWPRPAEVFRRARRAASSSRRRRRSSSRNIS